MSRSSTRLSLTKLQAPGVVWMASDIHLSASSPLTARAFQDFLRQAAKHADFLFLPGDIFDVWVGDDVALTDPPTWLVPILDAFISTSSQLQLFLGRGNRDFLMGQALARHLGAQLLPDTVRVQTDMGTLMLSHGDEYCTADAGYQRFRRWVRKPTVQRLFLMLSLRTRRAIARWARERSQKTNREKTMTIMDVHPDAIQTAFTASDCTLMVHGHTHRPAIHTLTIRGRTHTRIVLPDWDYDTPGTVRGGWLAIDKNGPVLHQASDMGPSL